MSNTTKVRVLRVTPSFANKSHIGSGLNSYYHSKYSANSSFVLTEHKQVDYTIPDGVSLVALKVPRYSLAAGSHFKVVVSYLLKIYQSLTFLVKSVEHIKNFRPDIVHLYSPIYILVGFYCKIRYNCKVVVSLHGTDIKRIEGSSFIRYIVFSFVDRVFLLSRRPIVGADIKGTSFLGNGYDNKIFTLTDNKMRERRNWFVTVAGLRPVKNHVMMLEAFKEFLELKSGYTLIIVGDGPLKINLMQKICDLGIENHVRFLGQKDQLYIARLFNLCHAFVLSSSSEGSPKVITEALATGLPVITTDVGDLRSRLNHESCIVTEHDSFSLAKGFLASTEFERIDRQHLSNTVKDMTWTNIAKRLDLLYKMVLEKI